MRITSSQAIPILKRVFNLSAQLLLPTLYFLVVFLFFPFHNAFSLDFDEGVNLVLAQMLLRKFALYSEIWNDHPPLFTFFLATVLRFFGQEVSVSRVSILLLTSGFIWASIVYLKFLWGWRHAIIGALLIISLPLFTKLSVSVMSGLPAIILAAFSMMALTYWHKQRKYFWLCISAGLMAFSILVKSFTGFLVPIFVTGLLLSEYNTYREKKDLKRFFLPALVWGVILTLLVVLPLLVIVKPAHFDQLFLNHLDAANVIKYQSNPEYRLAEQLRDATPILLLALIGVYYTLRSKNMLALYPVAWIAIAYIILTRYVPVWDHQQLLITIPAALVAAVGVGEAWKGLQQLIQTRGRFRPRDIINIVTLGVLIYVYVARGPAVLSEFDASPTLNGFWLKPTSTEAKFLRRISLYAPDTRWIITDIPMFAFYAKLPVPPNLVVFSLKRLESGNLTQEEVIATIQELKPEQVLLGRNELFLVREYLREHYQVVLKRDLLELYVSAELLKANRSP